MSEVGETTQQARGLPWRRLPWGVIATVAVTLLAVAMLVSGGLTAVVGAWLLATAAPIGLGALVRAPWAAAAPAGFWLIWVIVTSSQAPGGDLPRTPVLLAVPLALAGAAAVVFGQRNVASATDPEVRERGTDRGVPSIDEALASVPELPSVELDELALAGDAVDEALLELLDGEIAEAGATADAGDDPDASDEPEPQVSEDSDDDAAEVNADAETDVEHDTGAARTDEPPAEAEPPLAPAAAIAEAAQAVQTAARTDEPGTSNGDPLDLAAAVASVQAVASTSEADHDDGRVIEFDAISADDIEVDDAPLPAQTHAGRGRPRRR